MKKSKRYLDLQMCDVVKDCPSFHMLALDLDKVKVDGVEHERQSLQKNEDCHQIVNFEDGMFGAS